MANLDLHCRMIMEEYDKDRDSFVKMQDIATGTIRQVLKENGMLVTALESRVKERSSLEGKLALKGYKYASLSDLTDILGVRVITFYTDEVDKIASLVERLFEVDWENSVDKRAALETDRFGYMSLHYICRIPESLYKDPDHPEINEYRFEVQMRTALQHVWATAYHDTGYKSDIEVPKEYIRALSRLAGVLEIADEQFSSILNGISDYRRKVKGLIRDGKFEDLELNGDTFRAYLEIGPFDRLNSRIAAINKAEIYEQDMMRYLDALSFLGIKTLADLEGIKALYSDDAYRLAVLQLGNTDIDILSSTVGLHNLCVVKMLKDGGGEPGLRLLYERLYGSRKSNASAAKRIVRQAASINIV